MQLRQLSLRMRVVVAVAVAVFKKTTADKERENRITDSI